MTRAHGAALALGSTGLDGKTAVHGTKLQLLRQFDTYDTTSQQIYFNA